MGAMLPYTLLTVAVTFLAVVWRSASLAALEGLTCYILPETPEEVSNPTRSNPEFPHSEPLKPSRT